MLLFWVYSLIYGILCRAAKTTGRLTDFIQQPYYNQSR